MFLTGFICGIACFCFGGMFVVGFIGEYPGEEPEDLNVQREEVERVNG